MLQRALTPGEPVTDRTDATYGELVERAHSALATAATLPQDRFNNPNDARQELAGYLWFLRTAGQHVDLLGRLVGTEAEDVGSFGRHLTTTAHRDGGPSTWRTAALYLGTADDLIRSHLDLGLTNRTSEAEELLTNPRLLAAAREVVQLLSAAAAVRSRLTRRVAAVERGPSGDGHRSDYLFLTARRAEKHIHVQGRAAMWDLHRLGIGDESPALETLRTPIVEAAAPSPKFESALTALRSLRQLSYGQARGRVPASPASLRDLARLGEAATTPGVDWLPPPNSGLARVQQATILDGLTNAHTRWAQAGGHLTTTVQGLTRAPGRYAEAVRLLQAAVREQPSTRLAVIAALPTLATEASRTVLDLATRGSLVSRQPVPLQLRAAWARIPFEDVQALIESFETAGHASRAAAEGVRQLTGAPIHQSSGGGALGRGSAGRHLEQRLGR